MGNKDQISIKDKISFFKGKYPGIQFYPSEISLIAKQILKQKNCKLLVFGMGYDMQLWKEINAEGRTAFIEDNEDWFSKASKLFPNSESYLVEYKLFFSQWKDVLDKPEELYLELPEEIMNTEWDIVLVDGPKGGNSSAGDKPSHGRMTSIYMSSKLVKDGGSVFVHDCNRECERTYANKYLINLVRSIKERKILSRYIVNK